MKLSHQYFQSLPLNCRVVLTAKKNYTKKKHASICRIIHHHVIQYLHLLTQHGSKQEVKKSCSFYSSTGDFCFVELSHNELKCTSALRETSQQI